MLNNQINDSGQVNSGRRWDYRDNPWNSVADALAGITGNQRVEGHLIPVRLPNGLVFPHHFIEGQLVPFEGRINQPDQLLFSGFSFVDADRTAGKIEGSEWRVSDYKWTLQTPVIYPIDPVGAGLFRTDYIVGDPFGKTFYLKGEEGATYVPPSLPYKYTIIQEIQVSDADVSNVEPEIPSADGEPLYGPTSPLDSQGKAGDSYTVTAGADKGKEYKKRTIGGVTSWVLEFTPDAAGASSFASLSGAPADNAALDAVLSAIDADIETAQETANLAQASVDALVTDDIPESGTPTNKYFTTARVLATVAAGISFVNKAAITAASTILEALGQLQAQITFYKIEAYSFAAGNEDADITTGTAKISFAMPYNFHVNEAIAALNVATAGATFITNIKVDGVSIFSTNLSIDATERTSGTAATPAVIANPDIPKYSWVQVDFVQVGSTTPGKGPKYSFVGYKY